MKEENLNNKINSMDRFNINKGNVRQKIIKQSMNYHVIDGNLYDGETGEYIGDKFHADWLKANKKKNEYYEKNKVNGDKIKEHSDENGGFIFAIFNSNSKMIERFPSLNKKDIARLLYLSTYIHYETGRLQKGDGTRITLDNIHDEIRLSKRRCKDFINKLEKECIVIVEDGLLYINPNVFYKGNLKGIKSIVKNMRYTRLFKNTVRTLFNDAKENELAHLSVIYNVLPYINLNHNYICHNPLEENIDNIQTMDTVELASKLGYDRTTRLTSDLRKLRVNEQVVFAFYDNTSNSRKKNMIVNPSVIYGGNKAEHLEVLKGMFVNYKG